MSSGFLNDSRPPGLNRSEVARALLQTILGAVAVGLAYLAGVAWQRWLPLVWLVLSGLVYGLLPANSGRWPRICLGSAVLATVCAWGAFLTGSHPTPVFDEVNAWIAGLLAMVLGLVGRRPSAERLLPISLAFAWALASGGLWVGAGYCRNRPVLFYLGLGIEVALLAAIRLRFRLPPVVVQTIHTLILLLIALPIADCCVPELHVSQPRVSLRSDAVRISGYPLAGFAKWWNRYLEEWEQMGRTVFGPDPERVYPFRLRPNSNGRLFESQIHINSLGLRGPEIAADKGRAYRILALGESTTFGCTIGRDDRPWPELLERMIAERLRSNRPVEVINAGTPSYHLAHNLRRLSRELLSLKPDLIISYHGFNGFGLLDPRFTIYQEKSPPLFEPRPLQLLARFEYRFKLTCFRRWEDRALSHAPPLPMPPLDTEYGQAYRGLVELARTNGIGLILCNFSMAVNRRNPPSDVIFYREIFPLVRWQIEANELHSALLRALAAQTPKVSLIDTHPGLDGQPRQFIDLVHLTQEGRQQLAESIFTGISNRLQVELLSPLTIDP